MGPPGAAMGAATFIGSGKGGTPAPMRSSGMFPELVLPDAIIFLSRESAKTKRTKGIKVQKSKRHCSIIPPPENGGSFRAKVSLFSSAGGNVKQETRTAYIPFDHCERETLDRIEPRQLAQSNVSMTRARDADLSLSLSLYACRASQWSSTSTLRNAIALARRWNGTE